MGVIYEFNWILKLNSIQIPELIENAEFIFIKNGIRIYPINVPIDLVNDNWEAIARCVILSITLGNEETIGKCVIVSVYNDDIKAKMSQIWRDTLCYTKNDFQITDFSDKHIT